MERGIITLKALALATVPVVGLFVVLLLLQVNSVVVRAGKDEQVVASGAIAALSTINRKCSSPGRIQPCGALAEVDKALTNLSDLSVESKRAVRNADLVAEMEMKLLPEWNASLTSTLQHVDAATATINTSAEQLTAATLPVLGSANDVLSSTDATVKHLDTLAVNPNLPRLLETLDDTAVHIDRTTDSVAKVSDHFEKIIDTPKPHHWYSPIQKAWQVAWQLAMLAK